MFKKKVRVSNIKKPEMFFTALENFGVEADPINKRLKPILGVVGGFLASSVERSVLGAYQEPVVSQDSGLKGN